MSWNWSTVLGEFNIADLEQIRKTALPLLNPSSFEELLVTTSSLVNWTISLDDFKVVLSYLYDNPSDDRFNELFLVPWFREQVNTFLSESYPYVKNFWADSYANISFFISLLSKWLEWTFFEDWKFYSKQNFEEMFDAYISKIKLFQWDYDWVEFASYVNSFSQVCWILNIICVLSHNDNLRRDFIEEISVTAREKIDEIFSFFYEKWIDNDILKNPLLFYKWLTYLNFSHLKYISFESKDWFDKTKSLNWFLNDYDLIVDNIIFWYNICEESNFWNNPEKRNWIKWVEAWNLAYTISLILLKLSWKVDDEELFWNEKFKVILGKFLNEIFWEWNIPDCSSIDDVKKIVNNVLIKFYRGWDYLSVPEDLWNDKVTSNDSVEDFLKNIENFWNIDSAIKMEALHHLILFNEWVSTDVLIKIWEILNSEKYSGIKTSDLENYEWKDNQSKLEINIDYEVMKLKIFNIIFTRLVNWWVDIGRLSWLLEPLWKYIDNNKKSSQLLFSYSLLYVSIWYCYSFSSNPVNQKLALDNYAKFRQINPWDFDFLRYWIDIDVFYSNIWKFISEEDWTISELSELSENNRKSFLTKSWKWHSNRHFGIYSSTSKRIAYDELNNYVESQDWKWLDLKKLWLEVSDCLEKAFNWVVVARIIDKHSSQNPPIKSYEWHQELVITNWYELQLIYPKIHSDMYFWFRENSSDFIAQVRWRLEKYMKEFKEENKDSYERVSEFEKSLNNWKVTLVYQPICDSSWVVDKYEALSRVNEWDEVEIEYEDNWVIKRRKANIQDYIDAIEKLWRNDLSNRLRDEVLIPRAIEEMKKDPWLKLSINLGYFDFVDTNFMCKLEQLVALGTIDPIKVTFELLEWKWPNKDNSDVFRNLKKLKEMWFKIAMDDYWAWDSSSWRLAKMLELWLIDYIKIDRSIVERLWSSNPQVRRTAISMINWVVELANIWWPNWKVKVVAEYIKDKNIFEKAEELWVHLYQWYYFSQPIKPENFSGVFIPKS